VVGQTSLHRLQGALGVDDVEDAGGRDFHAHDVLVCTLLTGMCVEVGLASLLGDDNLYTTANVLCRKHTDIHYQYCMNV